MTHSTQTFLPAEVFFFLVLKCWCHKTLSIVYHSLHLKDIFEQFTHLNVLTTTCMLYEFSIGVVTKYHKPNVLKQKYIVSQLWRLKVWNQGVIKGVLSLSFWVESILDFSWLLVVSGNSWHFLAFLGLQLHQSNLCLCMCFPIIFSLCVSKSKFLLFVRA